VVQDWRARAAWHKATHGKWRRGVGSLVLYGQYCLNAPSVISDAGGKAPTRLTSRTPAFIVPYLTHYSIPAFVIQGVTLPHHLQPPPSLPPRPPPPLPQRRHWRSLRFSSALPFLPACALAIALMRRRRARGSRKSGVRSGRCLVEISVRYSFKKIIPEGSGKEREEDDVLFSPANAG